MITGREVGEWLVRVYWIAVATAFVIRFALKDPEGISERFLYVALIVAVGRLAARLLE